MSPSHQKTTDAHTRSGYQSVNPFNGKLLRTFEELSEPQLEAALATAASAFELWRKTSFAERSAIAEKAATLMLAQVGEFARPLTLDMGKLSVEAKGEVELSANIIRYYSQNAEAFLKPQPLAPAAGEAMILNEPLGLIFGVQPWNFPYYQLARQCGAGEARRLRTAERTRV